MGYQIYTTKRFDKEVEKLSEEENKRIDNIYQQLRKNPYVGDQLQIKVLREKKLKEKRMHYLVFEDLEVILMIAISNKKAQQRVINHIINNINVFRESVIKSKEG